jgi:hypothetical protein
MSYMVEGVKDGRRIREALKLRDWNRAQELVREWDVEGKKPKRKHRATIEEWRDQFAARRHSEASNRSDAQAVQITIQTAD